VVVVELSSLVAVVEEVLVLVEVGSIEVVG